MKIAFKIIIILLFVLLLRKGYGLTKKYLHAKRLKFGLNHLKLISPIDLSNLGEPKEISVGINIQNFSSTTFNIEQVSVDAYTESNELIASQKQPIYKSIEITPTQNNIVIVNYLLEPSGIRKLIKSAGGILKVGGNLITTGNYGLTLVLKGFVKSEGIKINVNEKITF